MKAILLVCTVAGFLPTFAQSAAAQPFVSQSLVVSGTVEAACRAGQSQVLTQNGQVLRLNTAGICRNRLGYDVSLTRSAALASATIILDGQPMLGTPQSQSGEVRAKGGDAAAGILGLNISPRL